MTVDYIDHVSQEMYDQLAIQAKSCYNISDRLLIESLIALVKSGRAAFEFIHNDDLRKRWNEEVKHADKVIQRRKEAWRKYNLTVSVLDRLTDEEKRILGVHRLNPKEPKN